jgi:hypothetical protein
MTTRTCPWCGGSNLRITNVGSDDVIYWEDRDCGYREQTCGKEYYDYNAHKMIQRTEPYKIKKFYKPNPPLPSHQRPDYLRNGVPSDTPNGQQALGGLS